MKHYKRIVILWLCVALLVPALSVAMEVGAAAPDFKLKSVTGEEISLSDYSGKLVLLKLATTWCPTCRQLSTEIEKIGEFLKGKEVVFLDVFVQDSLETVVKYLGDNEPPMTFHALLDDGQVYDAYSVYLIPRLLIVDAGQIVRFDSSGRNVGAKELQRMVEEFSPASTASNPS